MKKETDQYRQGYREAVAVFEAGFHPGYCRDNGEAGRVTRSMLKAGLDGKEAQRQRTDFIVSDRKKNHSGTGQQGAFTGGNGALVKSSAQIQDENVEAIYERRRLELANSLTKGEQPEPQGINA